MRFSRLALWGLVTAGAAAQVGANLTSMQTGPAKGSSYASSIMSDGSGTLYLVGSTYDPQFDEDTDGTTSLPESSCFVFAWEPYDGAEWAEQNIIGNDNALDSCHGVGLINPQALALIGNSEPGGLYSDPTNKMSGFASVLNKETLEVKSGTIIEMSDGAKIPYPISVVTDTNFGVYVIALTTVDDQNSDLYNVATQSQYPNWIQYEKYGSSYDMTVMKFDYSEQLDDLGFAESDVALTPAWHQEFPFNPEGNGLVPRAYLSGLILKDNSFLIVAGSTFGKGPGYGSAVNQDEDGFITLLNLETGELVGDRGNKNQQRIGSAEDDLVTGICDNPSDPNSFYLVGATDGDVGGVQDDQMSIQPGSRQAFIKKMDLTDLRATWTVQWGAIKGTEDTRAYALSCTVAEDGAVYVAGQVEDGAGIVQGYSVQESKGGDDIWVAKITDLGSDYNVDWMQQVGTDGADHLARYGGITSDPDTFNPIIYGDTTGSLARTRGAGDDAADIFVMTLDKDFEFTVAPPPEGGGGGSGGVIMDPNSGNLEGVQSGPTVGSIYASGMVYDGTDELYLIGNTYDPNILGGGLGVDSALGQSNCFVISIDLDDWNEGSFEFDQSIIYGDGAFLESCHGVGLVTPNTLMMIGNSEPNGIFADDGVKMSGFAATLDKNFLTMDAGHTFDMSRNDKIPYPMSVVTDGSKYAYVMALTSIDDAFSERYAQASAEEFPNWIQTEKYGSSFDMTIMKLEYSEEDDGIGLPEESITTTWKKEFPIDAESNGIVPRAYLGGLILKKAEDGEYLVVAGSTRGIGDGYGGAEGTDEDGFITIIDLDTGELTTNRKNQERIGSEEDDLITGICDNPSDPMSFYVVGATRGDVNGIQEDQLPINDGSLQPFIKKINMDVLHGDWTVQWGAVKSEGGNQPTTAFALDCVVVGDNVYVAGNVEKGASMVQGLGFQESKGGDDIWVAKVTDLGSDYNVNWVHQMGTAGDDHLARYGGITADRNGGVIVYGDTMGGLFRQRGNVEQGKTDIFVMRLNEADFEAPVAPPTDVQSPVAPPTDPPIAAPTEPPHEFVAIGVQFTGPVYPGGAAYDASLDRTLLTGATYGSDPVAGNTKSGCFVASLSMNSGDLVNREEYGNLATDDACSAITYSDAGDKAYVVGGTQQNGLLLEDGDVEPGKVQYGLILEVSKRSALKGFGFEDDAVVQYPISVVADPGGNFLYVASMASDDGEETISTTALFPDFTSGGEKKYGKDFYLVVERYQIEKHAFHDDPAETIVQDWRKVFKPDGTDNGIEGIIVSSMVMGGGGDQLVLTGSTRESGGPFGTNDGTDLDGWIMKLDPETGDLFNSDRSTRSSVRVDDADQDDDWIAAVCINRFDQDSIYIVGATDEVLPGYPEGSTHPFIAKIDLNGLTRVWRAHLPMDTDFSNPPEAHGLGCAVAPDSVGGKVYLVGNIKDGAVMRDAEEVFTHGKDDIFIVQFDATNGDIEWIRQVGSEDNDRLAHGNPITLDADGNAIVFGNTYGSLYYTREADSGVSDAFAMTFSKIDGSYKPIVSQGGIPHDKPQDLTSDTELDSQDEEDYTPDFVPDNIVALQTGPDVGPSYAGAMEYDRFSNAVYVTGATYGTFAGPGIRPLPESSCLFGVVILPKLQWKERETYGTRDVPEACNALSLTKYGGNDAAIVVGSTEENGLLTKIGQGNKAQQYGFAMDLANSDGTYSLLGGALIDANNVQYPLAVLAEDEKVWIVSMASKDTKVTADFDKVSNNDYPNFTTGGIEKYGSQYTIVVEKHTMRRSPEAGEGVVEEQTLDLDWRKPFETADMESVFVSGMIRRGEELVIVGSTRGSPGGEDMDGIMAKVSADDGSFVFEGASARSVAYFASVTGRDDWIMNACPDPDDEGHFYIVGATKGLHDPSVSKDSEDLTVHAVMAKIKLDTLSAVWTKQYTVKHASGATDKEAAAAALGCDVIPNEKLMYVAGVVENFATIHYEGGPEQESAGGDDIFVSLVSTVDGTTRWLKQVGSNGDDRVARGGGVKADVNRNAVVFGDTTGSFYRSRSQDARPTDSDLFMMLFDIRDGKHLPPLKAPPVEGTTTAPPKEWFPTYTLNLKDPKLLAFAITTLVLLAVSIICCITYRRGQRKKLDAQKTSIFTYLQQFDVEDIDLRKSPPGGWHGTYLNKLAYGINDGEAASHAEESRGGGSGSYETAPLTHSSVVADSLFMDTSTSPNLGYADEPSYDDFRPRTYEDDHGATKARDII